MQSLGSIVFYVLQIIGLLGLLALLVPWRRTSRFVARRTLACSPERAWDELIPTRFERT
jgi:hypothetical protein